MGETIARRRAALGDRKRHVEQLGARRRVRADRAPESAAASHSLPRNVRTARRAAVVSRVASRHWPEHTARQRAEERYRAPSRAESRSPFRSIRLPPRCRRGAITIRVQRVENAKAQLRMQRRLRRAPTLAVRANAVA